MKEVKYTCDNPDCNNYKDNLDEWLLIGSSDESSLRIINNLPDRNIISKGKHKDIHYCSAICFLLAFVDKITIDNAEKIF